MRAGELCGGVRDGVGDGAASCDEEEGRGSGSVRR